MSKTTNNKKTNATINFENMLLELNAVTTKHQLVDTFNKYGYVCTTAKTDTNNTNDLYAQFRQNKCGDVSRIQFTKKSLKVYATNKVMTDLTALDKTLKFDIVNDGSVRKHRLTISNTIENFTKIFGYFVSSGIVEKI
jgi:ribosomal protein S8